MNPDHLAELADQILQISAGRPKQVTINRAVSTAYYALFHALAGECVARLVGSPRSPHYWEIVTPIHRALDHGAARGIVEALARDRARSRDLRTSAGTFVELQPARARPTMARLAGVRAAKLGTPSIRRAGRSRRPAPCRRGVA